MSKMVDTWPVMDSPTSFQNRTLAEPIHSKRAIDSTA